MWQRRTAPGGPGIWAGLGRGGRLWLLAAGGLILVYILSQVLGGAFGSAPSQPAAPDGADAAATPGFLASGYAALDQSAGLTTAPSFWDLWSGMILPLAIVIVGAYALLRGLKYVNMRMSAASSQSRALETLDSLSLGQHGTIHLVRVGDRVVVVGAGGQQVSLLTELAPEQAAALLDARRAELEGTVGPTRGVLAPFRDLVAGRMEGPWQPVVPFERAGEVEPDQTS